MAHTTVTDGVDNVLAAHHNELATALDDLEASPRLVLSGGMTNSSPADNTIYYFGQPATTIAVGGLVTATEGKIMIPVAGTITRVDFRVLVAGTLATTELSILSIVHNNTTTTGISAAVDLSVKSATYSATISMAVAAGDYIEFKFATATWATNPTSVYINGQAYM